MKTMKGTLLKKLKSIKPIGFLKPDRVLQVYASDGFFENYFPTKSNSKVETDSIRKEEDANKVNQSTVTVQEPEIIDVSELMRDLESEETEMDHEIDDKENIRPGTEAKNPSAVPIEMSRKLEAIKEFEELRNGDSKNIPLSEINFENFRRPDLNSCSLFDPNLLAAFEQAVMEVKAQEAERRARMRETNLENIKEEDEENRPSKARKIEENRDPLLDIQENRDPLLELEENRDPLFDFEERCPPGGIDSVVLYTTGLRGIRKTFEDCNSIKFLLDSFRVLYSERDISMHSVFREELWMTLGGKIVPPRLFIKGRYIGGAEVVLTLHEQGKLRPLFEGVPVDWSEGPCDGCAGFRFVVCSNCSGSHKVVSGDAAASSEDCPECNENGLIICPLCC
ncbi:hypothetical protein RHSIM_Rhsim03G0094300 [Rhododendron simsii]|uniref:Glutaredoxin domain-containing protein n=1 Tax=Rhododendron simsii TaxID=118357 RepID=A0A834HB42_RHOSS|nr:hypothetical protein RHSIM_Rhsim03G0094300 [Rhododendron simsii]